MTQVRNDPRDHRLLFARYSGSGQWDRALAAARDWLAAEPENFQAHRGAAQALINLGRPAEALPRLAAALRAQPGDDFSHRLASIAHFELGNRKEADEAIHRALSIAPKNSGHWRHLAWMCFRQGDRTAGRKWAEKALELAPEDPASLNILALCQPDSADGRERKQAYLRRALELSPNDPALQNNLGVHHLNVSHDLAAAEKCFRRALTLEPENKVYRQNLILALKKRDWIYRTLCAPRDLIARQSAALRARRQERSFSGAIAWVISLVVGRYFIGLLLIWAVLVWPLVKVYEFLTLGDLQGRAGEIAADRGGLFGYRNWPMPVRLGIFIAILVGFWAVPAFLFKQVRTGAPAWGIALAKVGAGFLFAMILRLLRGPIGYLCTRPAYRRRSKRFSRLLPTQTPDRGISHE